MIEWKGNLADLSKFFNTNAFTWFPSASRHLFELTVKLFGITSFSLLHVLWYNYVRALPVIFTAGRLT